MMLKMYRVIFCVGLGIFFCANMSSMQHMQNVPKRALLAGMHAAMRTVPSRFYNSTIGNKTSERLRELSQKVNATMAHNRDIDIKQGYPGMEMGVAIEDSLEWVKDWCDERDKLLKKYEDLKKQEAASVALAECKVLEERLEKKDAQLLAAREELVKDWTQFVFAVERNRTLGKIADELEKIAGLHRIQVKGY